MQQLLHLLPALACPLGMGAMMYFMMRPGAKQAPNPPAGPQDQEVADLRQQVQLMRAEQQRRSSSETPTP